VPLFSAKNASLFLTNIECLQEGTESDDIKNPDRDVISYAEFQKILTENADFSEQNKRILQVLDSNSRTININASKYDNEKSSTQVGFLHGCWL
jgi:hypothetical protein